MKLKGLKRGMRCTYRNGDSFIFSHYHGGFIYYFGYECNSSTKIVNMTSILTHPLSEDLDIVKVEDITENGYKTIWVRKEKKYTLRLPHEYSKRPYLNYRVLKEDFIFDTIVNSSLFKTQFTQAEIDKLPNKDFIKSLEKEEVK